MAVMHLRVGEGVACGRDNHNVSSTSMPSRVRCKNCRQTSVFQSACQQQLAAQVAARFSARKAWAQRLARSGEASRTPRGPAQVWV